MPTYDLKYIKTGEIESHLISISKKEAMVESGEYVQVHLGVAATVTHTGNIVNKTSTDWKNHLERIKKSAGKRVKNTVNV